MIKLHHLIHLIHENPFDPWNILPLYPTAPGAISQREMARAKNNRDYTG